MRQWIATKFWQLAVRCDPDLVLALKVTLEHVALEAVYVAGWNSCVKAIEAVRDSVPGADLANTIDVLKSAPIRSVLQSQTTWTTPTSKEIH